MHCHYDQSHYVLLYDIDDTSVYLIDGTEAKRIPRDTFLQLWTRNSLLVGQTPFLREEIIGDTGWTRLLVFAGGAILLLSFALLCAPRAYIRVIQNRVSRKTVVVTLLGVACAFSGCRRDVPTSRLSHKGPARIYVDRNLYSLGLVPLESISSSTYDVPIAIRNNGGENLVIQGIETGCVCTSVEVLTNRTIQPGENSELTARIKLGYSPERRRTALTITTNDPANPVVEVAIEWQVVNPLRTLPPSYHWPRLGLVKRYPSISSCTRIEFLSVPSVVYDSIRTVQPLNANSNQAASVVNRAMMLESKRRLRSAV